MADLFGDTPPYVRFTDAFGWQGANHQNGPWRKISAPREGFPFQTTPHTQPLPAMVDPQLDAKRLRYLMDDCSAEMLIEYLPKDCSDYALDEAKKQGRSKPNEQDELNGFRQMIDDSMAHDQGLANT